ncbi:MAG: glycosyl hydrolase [Acidobacteria bacterium]|nr:glycosyl hydrolase [Acidobacteriota bacterium]MBI3488361.1 glycosyl hydrolase [Acidobacteriota bacterium]
MSSSANGIESARRTSGQPLSGWFRASRALIWAKQAGLVLIIRSFAMGGEGLPPVDLAKQQWNGNAICYSGYRLGQHPDRQAFPTEAQVLDDLRILERNWRLIRVYGADRHSRDVLAVIRKHRLNLRVMLGIWLSGKPGKEAENQRQIAYGIHLAKAFPEAVAAVNVGNEALVSWSDHRMPEEAMVECVRQVKGSVACPVTVADDFLYWIQPGNKLLPLIDFITLHSYPLWGHQDIEEGLPSTVSKYDQVRKLYPGKTIVFGEVGWASYTEPHAQHVPGAGSESKQKRYYEEINAWAKNQGVTAFFFEAFDEPWKGQGTEGHWGVFSVDRKAKPVVREAFQDLTHDRTASPGREPLPGQIHKADGN